MREIYFIVGAFSLGWSMRGSVAQRFCLRCWTRAAVWRAAKWSQEKKALPPFLAKFILVTALEWNALMIVQDAARVFGWKQIWKMTKSLAIRYRASQKSSSANGVKK